jgi:signal transduction histidine kinase
VLSLVVAYALVRQRFVSEQTQLDLLGGLAFGAIASLSLFSGVELSDGLVFDGRALTAATRLGIGGSGTGLGIAHAATAALLGLGTARWADARGTTWTFSRLLGVGAVLIGAAIAWVYIALPADRASVVVASTVGFFSVAVAVGGTLLQRTVRFLELQDELERSLEAKNAFIASVSHELRTPLTELYGFAEELARDPARFDDAEREELLQLIAASGATAHDVLDDLIAISRLSMEGIRVEHEPVDVVKAIAQVTSFHPEWRFPVDAPEGPVLAFGDERRIRQIVRNLVTNALRHGGSHRLIRVTVDGGRVTTCICDDGPGISEELNASPFELYSTTGTSTGDVPALGVGLWLSQNLARLMGSELEYRREDGRTHFSFTLDGAEGSAPIRH